MLLILPLLLQATAIPLASDFDLADVPPNNPCDREAGSAEIIVCARPPDIPPAVIASDYAPPPEIPGPGIGFMLRDTVRANISAQNVELPNGFISNRAMVTFAIPF